MVSAPEKRERPPVKDWMSVLIFDGKGGVRRLSDEEEGQPYEVPAKGFALISGNSRSPDFKVWLREQLGEFNADTLSVPSTRTRCIVLDDKAIVVLRVARSGAAPDDIGRQLLSLWLEKAG